MYIISDQHEVFMLKPAWMCAKFFLLLNLNTHMHQFFFLVTKMSIIVDVYQTDTHAACQCEETDYYYTELLNNKVYALQASQLHAYGVMVSISLLAFIYYFF